jgi:PAS domain S-box-containing protein
LQEVDTATRETLAIKIKKEGRIVNEKLHATLKNGQQLDVLYSIDPVTISGTPHWLFSLHDVSEIKKAEQLLIQKEKYLDSIINNIGDPVFVKDEQSKLLLVNDSFCKLFDLSRKDIIGKTLAEDVLPAEMDTFLSIDKQVLDTGIENINEEFLTVRGGETAIISTRKTRFVDDNGNKFLIGTIRDITERKKAESALAVSEDRLRAILQNEPACVKLLDKDCSLVDMNPAGLAMIEVNELADVKGRSVLQIVNEPYRNAFTQLLNNVFEGQSGSLEFEVTGMKGTKRLLETNAVPLKEADGTIKYLLGVTRDITEKRKGEDQIIRLNKDLEQRVKERTAELEKANQELEEINDLFVGREARIIELKEELEKLKTKMGRI